MHTTKQFDFRKDLKLLGKIRKELNERTLLSSMKNYDQVPLEGSVDKFGGSKKNYVNKAMEEAILASAIDMGKTTVDKQNVRKIMLER